jgi:hypothetical protein
MNNPRATRSTQSGSAVAVRVRLGGLDPVAAVLGISVVEIRDAVAVQSPSDVRPPC